MALKIIKRHNGELSIFPSIFIPANRAPFEPIEEGI